jgi:hypothetical protein
MVDETEVKRNYLKFHQVEMLFYGAIGAECSTLGNPLCREETRQLVELCIGTFAPWMQQMRRIKLIKPDADALKDPTVMEKFTDWLRKGINNLYEDLNQDVLSYSIISFVRQVLDVLQYIEPEWLEAALKLNANDLKQALLDETGYQLLNFYKA